MLQYTQLETADEAAVRVHNYHSYWWRWEFLKMKQDRPEIYELFVEEFNKLEGAETRQ